MSKYQETHNYCYSCKQDFDNPVQLQDYDDELVDSSTDQESKEMPVCPHCGSDDFEEIQHYCDNCGDGKPDNELHCIDECYLCRNCLKEIKEKGETK